MAGTIFDDLLSEENYENVLRQTEEICALVTKLPPLPVHEGQHFAAPYLTVMDWGMRRGITRQVIRTGRPGLMRDNGEGGWSI